MLSPMKPQPPPTQVIPASIAPSRPHRPYSPRTFTRGYSPQLSNSSHPQGSQTPQPTKRKEPTLTLETALEGDPLYMLWQKEHQEASPTEIAVARLRRQRELEQIQTATVARHAAEARAALEEALREQEFHERSSSYRSDIQPADAKQLVSAAEDKTASNQPIAGPVPPPRPSRTQVNINAQENAPKRRLPLHLSDPSISATTATSSLSSSNLFNRSNRRGSVMLKAAAESIREMVQKEKEQQLAEQRAAWKAFLAPATGGNEVTGVLSMKSLNFVVPGEADMTSWIGGLWKRCNHHHHEAATKIQCAVRCFSAKKRVEHQRRRRHLSVELIMKSEEHLQRLWELEMVTGEAEVQEASRLERMDRIMQGFLSRVRATSEHRSRSAKRMAAEQLAVQNYASVRIQAQVRGMLAKKRVERILHPLQIATASTLSLLEEQVPAAIQIQRIFRGWSARRHIVKSQAAALRIQKVFRSYLCECLRARIARKKRVEEGAAVAEYAASILQRFCRRIIARKHALLTLHVDVLSVLHHYGRGYLCRKRIMGPLANEHRRKAAIVIQCCARKHFARARVRIQRDFVDERVRNGIRNHAAHIITRFLRAHALTQGRERERDEEEASQHIQRVWRGHRGRKIAVIRRQTKDEDTLLEVRRHDAAVCIQALARGVSCRKELQAKNKLPQSTQQKKKKKKNQKNLEAAPVAEASATPEQTKAGETVVVGDRYFIRLACEAANKSATCFYLRILLDASTKITAAEPAVVQQETAFPPSPATPAPDRTGAATIVQLWFRQFVARRRAEDLRDIRVIEQHEIQRQEAACVLTRTFKRAQAKSRAKVEVEARRKTLRDSEQQPPVSSAEGEEDAGHHYDDEFYESDS